MIYTYDQKEKSNREELHPLIKYEYFREKGL